MTKGTTSQATPVRATRIGLYAWLLGFVLYVALFYVQARNERYFNTREHWKASVVISIILELGVVAFMLGMAGLYTRYLRTNKQAEGKQKVFYWWVILSAVALTIASICVLNSVRHGVKALASTPRVYVGDCTLYEIPGSDSGAIPFVPQHHYFLDLLGKKRANGISLSKAQYDALVGSSITGSDIHASYCAHTVRLEYIPYAMIPLSVQAQP